MFAYCAWLAHRANVLKVYLTSRVDNRVLAQVYHPAGAVTALDVIRGDWWRLLTTCFVHAGILHILLNMYTLRAAGRFVEQTWGHARYLVIYLASGWAGSCVGLAYSPVMVVATSTRNSAARATSTGQMPRLSGNSVSVRTMSFS